MKLFRITSLALLLGVACLMLSASAFAGTTKVADPVVYALQVGKANQVYTIVGGSMDRVMDVARALDQNFFLDVTLPAGFVWTGTGLPAIGNVTQTGGTPPIGIGDVHIFSGGTAGSNKVRFLVPVTASTLEQPTISVNPNGWTIKDTTGALSGANSVTLKISLKTFDSATGDPLDVGVEEANWLKAINPLEADIKATKATIDVGVASARKLFIPVINGGDTFTVDHGGKLLIGVGTSVLDNSGVEYTIRTADSFVIVMKGNFHSVTTLDWGGRTHTVTSGEISAGEVDWTIPGTASQLDDSWYELSIAVDGTTQLTTRAFTVAVNSICALNANNDQIPLMGESTFTVWGINGTVLLSNWVNGNTPYWKSRIYLFNPTATPNATVLVRAFSLSPAGGNSVVFPADGNPIPLSVTIGPQSGLTIKLEDIQAGLGIPAPYTDNGGNLALEVTVYADQVTGASNTFSADLTSSSAVGFGMANLQLIQGVPGWITNLLFTYLPTAADHKK